MPRIRCNFQLANASLCFVSLKSKTPSTRIDVEKASSVGSECLDRLIVLFRQKRKNGEGSCVRLCKRNVESVAGALRGKKGEAILLSGPQERGLSTLNYRALRRKSVHHCMYQPPCETSEGFRWKKPSSRSACARIYANVCNTPLG